jgi:hypothetical protein
MVNVREGTLKFLSHQNVRFRLPIFVHKAKARLRVLEEFQIPIQFILGCVEFGGVTHNK